VVHSNPNPNRKLCIKTQSSSNQTMNMNSAYLRNRIPTTPPKMISPTITMMRLSIHDDTASFGALSFSPPASLASSYCSSSSEESASSCISKSQVGGLSRSQCVSNLSALGGTASVTSIKRQASYKSGPNEGWGYFVDTPHHERPKAFVLAIAFKSTESMGMGR
jgi:hypothetical protein